MDEVNKRKRVDNVSSALDLVDLLYKLKTTKRTGWVLKGVKEPESIADHMYRMSIMAMLACETERREGKDEASDSDSSVQKSLDANRCIKMALVHDLGESIVGDFTPHCKVSKDEKYRLERDAMAKIRCMIEGAVGEGEGLGSEVEELWLEYEEGKSPEALLVKDLDKIEMIAQAYEYENDQDHVDLEDFFQSTSGKFVTITGKKWAEEIVRRRIAVLKKRAQLKKEALNGQEQEEGQIPQDEMASSAKRLRSEKE
uniref:5'-deoxynucleotidase n=1 Tax=Polytomella parva TaxID=51329 RepID=A0A7S0VEF1_9CHLO|nr:Hd domain-containing protein 2-like (HD2) [Polytomella parva]|mmetsp:Transcript_34139/g.61556  ORF Transcript_34139/g.61556 Transcript_34139/m.61556 type:complete len:256 (+) Transcript_34139:112-879(+)